MSTMTLAHSRPHPTLRLTRRGRLVVFTVGLLVVLALGVLWGSGSVATERAGTPDSTRVVQVQPGDTLYDLAAGLETDGDINAMVEQIQDLNALDSGALQVGQRLRVPTG